MRMLNLLFIGIPKDAELNERQKLILVNMLTLICILVNLIYFLLLISMGKVLFSSFNLACGTIFGFLGFYFMKTGKYNIAKVFNFIVIPGVFIVFCLIYGDLGFNLYFVLFSISSFFILENKKTIFFINIWLFVVFVFLNIGIAKKIIVPYDEEIANWGRIFYWSNLICGFICSYIILAVFKAENLRYEISLKEKNKQILQQNEEISAQRDLLERMNNSKNKFFSIIAHDLKNPLIGMIYNSEMLFNELKNNSENKEQLMKKAENIYLSTQNEFKLLENLLEWARSQTEEIKFIPGEVYINELIHDSILSMQSFFESKKISVSFENIPIRVYADKNMLSTILRNLLSNAVKYTKSNGSVSIVLKKCDNVLEVKVIDTGVGMSEDVIEKLFGSELIDTQPGTQNEKGTGLGLILCKDFVTKNGGIIWVESELEVGSTFYFTIPLIKN